MLLIAKQTRENLAKDAQTLQSRLNLLNAAEARMLSKIELARKQAEAVLKVSERRESEERMKEHLQATSQQRVSVARETIRAENEAVRRKQIELQRAKETERREQYLAMREASKRNDEAKR